MAVDRDDPFYTCHQFRAGHGGPVGSCNCINYGGWRLNLGPDVFNSLGVKSEAEKRRE